MGWRSGRTWCRITASPIATSPLNASWASSADRRAPKLQASSRLDLGEEAQVDYGTGPMVRAPKTGKYRRTRLFVMTLGYSRKSVRLLTFKSSSHIWAELHETAFRRLGGSPRYIILDNLREGVIVSDYYAPTLNPLFKDVLAHYGVVAMPCRVRDPDRKGKVESGVGHAQKTPLKGQRFESLDLAQAYLDRWETRWADTRIHGTTKRQVAAMFAEEKPSLLPLPLEPFRYYQYGKRRRPSRRLCRSRGRLLRTSSPVGSDGVFRCSGTRSTSGSSIRRPSSYCANMSVRNGVDTGCVPRTTRRKRP